MNIVKLSEVADIKMGQSPDGAHYNLAGQGYPLIGGASDFGEESPNPKKFTSVASKVSSIGDIIMCIRATIGDLNWSDKEYALGRGVVAISPRKEVELKYLWYFLLSAKQYFISRGKGATFLQIVKDDIEQAKMPLPDLDTQNKISSQLELAHLLLLKRTQTIQKLDELLQAVFIEMFGTPSSPKFPIGTIREMVSEVKYGSSSKAGSEGEYPILRMNNITYSGDWNFSDLKYIDLKTNEVDKYTVKKGDLLFNRTNSKELVGKTAVYRELETMAFAGYLVRLRANEKGNTEYISAYLNSHHGKNTLQHMSKSIVGMANINAQELQDIKIQIPPIELQNVYANIVNEITKKKKTYLQSKQKLNEMLQSLLHQFFQGEYSEQYAN